MGHRKYSNEERKTLEDAQEARMAQFLKAEAGTKARREAASAGQAHEEATVADRSDAERDAAEEQQATSDRAGQPT